VRARELALDLVFVDPQFQHVTDRSMLERLREGPVRDALAAGCESVWLAGVSLGAFLGLAFAERYRGEVDGVCLIAPYLGTRIVTKEITRAGGAAGWDPGTVADDDEDRRVWRFLVSGTQRGVELWLGYGRDDRFADSQQILARALPPESVTRVDGAHDWPTWQKLWGAFLDQWAERARRPNVGAAS
jgi:pimeloyl-ACP methyl ester carboxylesterase